MPEIWLQAQSSNHWTKPPSCLKRDENWAWNKSCFQQEEIDSLSDVGDNGMCESGNTGEQDKIMEWLAVQYG